MERYLVSLIIFLLSSAGLCHAKGLLFPGKERRFADRSSYCVIKKDFVPKSVSILQLDFEYAPHNLDSPGYILFVKNAEGTKAFNMTYSFAEKHGILSFAQDGKKMLAEAKFPIDDFPRKLPVSVSMNMKTDSVVVKIGNEVVRSVMGLDKEPFSPQIYFGMCGHILETASFFINNLSVKLDGKEFQFPLDESKGNDVHSADGRIIGEVSNPIWLINRSYYWSKIFSSDFNSEAGCVCADAPGRFIIYSGDSITIFEPRHKTVTRQRFSYIDNEWYNRLGMGFYNPLNDVVVGYELDCDRTFVGEIDIKKLRCDVKDKGSVNLQMHHHSAAYFPERGKILLFGGYGNRQYYNDFIEYDLNTCSWDTLRFTGDLITPRFFASMCVAKDNNSLYVYGGKGNAQGKQDLGVEYYYDLYKIDLEKRIVKKLWEHPAPECDRVPARFMVPSQDGDYLYVLAYPEFHPHSVLQLYRMSVADGSYEALGDSIPIVSEEIATNAALYFSRENARFYCVVQEFKVAGDLDKVGANSICIYSLNAPPVSLAEVRRYDRPESSWSGGWWLSLLVLPVGGAGLWLWRQRKTVNTKFKDKEDSRVLCEQEATNEQVSFPRHNSIQLFGLFTAFDRKGRDVAYMFTPKSRQLFIYLLINSIGKDGVLSSDLNGLFWPDKPDENIKNLKNVTINKLRKVLQEFDGVELVHHKGYFKVEISDDFYCDYFIMHHITDGFSISPEKDSAFSDIMTIIGKGKFLQGMEWHGFDYARQQIENYSISVLSERIMKCFKNGDNIGTLSACKALVIIDPLSEQAMEYAVKVNVRMKRDSKARNIYNSFVKEHYKVMGEDYCRSFEQVGINK